MRLLVAVLFSSCFIFPLASWGLSPSNTTRQAITSSGSSPHYFTLCRDGCGPPTALIQTNDKRLHLYFKTKSVFHEFFVFWGHAISSDFGASWVLQENFPRLPVFVSKLAYNDSAMLPSQWYFEEGGFCKVSTTKDEGIVVFNILDKEQMQIGIGRTADWERISEVQTERTDLRSPEIFSYDREHYILYIRGVSIYARRVTSGAESRLLLFSNDFFLFLPKVPITSVQHFQLDGRFVILFSNEGGDLLYVIGVLEKEGEALKFKPLGDGHLYSGYEYHWKFGNFDDGIIGVGSYREPRCSFDQCETSVWRSSVMALRRISLVGDKDIRLSAEPWLYQMPLKKEAVYKNLSRDIKYARTATYGDNDVTIVIELNVQLTTCDELKVWLQKKNLVNEESTVIISLKEVSSGTRRLRIQEGMETYEEDDVFINSFGRGEDNVTIVLDKSTVAAYAGGGRAVCSMAYSAFREDIFVHIFDLTVQLQHTNSGVYSIGVVPHQNLLETQEGNKSRTESKEMSKPRPQSKEVNNLRTEWREKNKVRKQLYTESGALEDPRWWCSWSSLSALCFLFSKDECVNEVQ